MADTSSLERDEQGGAATPGESEFRVLLRLGLPLMGAQLAQMLMGVVDTIMAGRLSAVDLAGIALGGNALWPVMLLFMGLLQAVTPTVSQLNGAGRQREIGAVIRQACWLAFIASFIIAAWIRNTEFFYRFMEVDPEVAAVSTAYLRYTSWGLPGLMGYFVLRYLAEGMGFTRPTLIIAIGMLILKVPFNLVFMYGWLGAPALGGAGCGISMAIIMWLELLAMFSVAAHRRFRHTGWLDRFSWPEWEGIKPLLIVGAPIGATLFLEVGLFALTTLLLGRFGADVVASHTIAMNVGGIVFMLPLALGIAATIRIGFNIGAGRLELARRTAGVAIAGAVAIAAAAVTLIVLFRTSVASIYTSEAAVMELATTLMLFVAAFQIFDATQATAIGALRGYKDTRLPMVINMVGYWVIGLPIGCTLGFGWLGEPIGVYGFWVGLVIGLGVVAAALNYRLWRVSHNRDLVERLSRV